MSSHGSDENMDYRPITGKHHTFKTPFKEGHPRNPSSTGPSSAADESETQYDNDYGENDRNLFRYVSPLPFIKREPGLLKRAPGHQLTSSSCLRSTPPHSGVFNSSPACSSPSFAVSKRIKPSCHQSAPSRDVTNNFSAAVSRSYHMPVARTQIGGLAKAASEEVGRQLEVALASPESFADQAVLDKTHKATDFVPDAFTRKILVEKEETKQALEYLGSLLWIFAMRIEELVHSRESSTMRAGEEGNVLTFRACLLFFMSRPADDGSMDYLGCVRRFIKNASLSAFKIAPKHVNWAAQLVDVVAVDVNALKGNLDTHEGQEGLCAYHLARYRLASLGSNHILAKSFLRKIVEHAPSLPHDSQMIEQVIRTTIDAAAGMLMSAEANSMEDDEAEECNSSVGSIDGTEDQKAMSKSIADLRRANKLIRILNRVTESMSHMSTAHFRGPLRDKAFLHARVLYRLGVSADKMQYRLDSEHALFHYCALCTAAEAHEDAFIGHLCIILSMEERAAELSSIEVQWNALFAKSGVTPEAVDKIVEILKRTSERKERPKEGGAGKAAPAAYFIAVAKLAIKCVVRTLDGDSLLQERCISQLGYLVVKAVDASQVDAVADFLQFLVDERIALGDKDAQAWLMVIDDKATASIDEKPTCAFKLLALATSPVFLEAQHMVTDMTRVAAIMAIESGTTMKDVALLEAISFQPDDVQAFLHCFYCIKQNDEEEALRVVYELTEASRSLPKESLLPLLADARLRRMAKLADKYAEMVWAVAEHDHSVESLKLVHSLVSLQCQLGKEDASICRDGGQATCEMIDRCVKVIFATIKDKANQGDALAEVVALFVGAISDLTGDVSLKWSDESRWHLSEAIILTAEACIEHGLLVGATLFETQLKAGLQHVSICRDTAKSTPEGNAETWLNLYHCVECCERYLKQARSSQGFLSKFESIEAELNDCRLTALLEAQEWEAILMLCRSSEIPLEDSSFERVLTFVSKSMEAPQYLFRQIVEFYMTKHHTTAQTTKTFNAKLLSPWIVKVSSRLTLKRAMDHPEEYERTLCFMQIVIEAFLQKTELRADPAWPEGDLATMRMHTARHAKEILASSNAVEFKAPAALSLLECSIALNNCSMTRSEEEKRRYERWLRDDQDKVQQQFPMSEPKQEPDFHDPNHTTPHYPSA